MFKSKKLAVAAATALLLPAVAAPGTYAARSNHSAKATANLIWFMRTEPKEVPWEKAEVAAFSKIHPEIHINLITALNPNGQFDLKFNQLIQSGTPADIWSHLGQDGFQDYYHRGILLNLNPYLKAVNYNWGGTPTNLINTYKKSDGGIYGVPSITLGSYLYYNKDIFDAYNKAHPSDKVAYPPVNWDDKTWTQDKMISIAKKLTGMSFKTSSGTTKVFGYLDGQWPPMASAFQAGTDMFPPGSYDKGTPATVNLTDPRIVKIYQQNGDFFNVTKISPPYSKVKQINDTGAGDAFQLGDVAMHSTGGWGFRNYGTVSFHWAAAALPWRVRNTDILFTDPYMVSKTTKYPKEALEFIQFLTNKDSMTSYIKNVGFTPSNPDNLGLWYSQYSKITGMSVADLQTLVAGARKYGIESPNHLIVNFSQIVNTMQKYIDAIYFGKGTAASELSTAQTQINAILAQTNGQ